MREREEGKEKQHKTLINFSLDSVCSGTYKK